MAAIIKTRFMHFHKQWLSLLFWLLVPVVFSTLFVVTATQWQQETQIPVGLVVEDESKLAADLTEAINDNPLLSVQQTEMNQALRQLEQHQLDSVFVIRDGYEEEISSNNRNRLITAYTSDRSFAYTPVKEAIASYVQEDASSSRAAHYVIQLAEQQNGNIGWNWEEIVTTSKEIKKQEALLHTTFSFHQSEKQEDTSISLWNIWGIWAAFALLSTFFLFDWLIKERQSSITLRLSLLNISYKSYLLYNGLIYLALLWLVDGIVLGIFDYYLDEQIRLADFLSMLSFQFSISTIAFLFAQFFRSTFHYYVSVLPIVMLLSILGGAWISVPFDHGWVTALSPIDAFLKGKVVNSWLLGSVILLACWYFRKEKAYA
ncbi:ABC transporter permease [Virgibacillus senegalensis]|uniref:ABC transporter permease n=1 Tax=Virgibacillus senegalensis TaxID=1499679 RepID=UPI00069F073E|nr:ABC transporter permease [Virgibacillus senegalensis]